MTFAQATFVLAAFVHIRNISAVTDQILAKLFGPNFLQALDQKRDVGVSFPPFS